ncbi:MAG: IPT/TIG domain-containing protein [Gammaproteobacteria bacterium]
MNNISNKVWGLLLMQFIFINSVYAHGDHSVPCSGPHKNDPGCDTVTVAAPPVSVTSVQIDWVNETIIVGGANFSASTMVTIAGSPATINVQTATQLDVAFTALSKGNHNLVVDDAPSTSSDSMSFFVKSEMIDPALTVCPCEDGVTNDWSTELGALWSPPATKATDCYELSPGGPGNPEDIAGTVLTDSTDPSVYPHYPIGAAFTEDPNESVCQLTRVDTASGVPVTDLVKKRINRQQQSDCRSILDAHVCSSITPVP